MLFQYRRTVRRATRWFLRHRNNLLTIEQSIDLFKPTFAIMSEKINSFLIKSELEELERVENDLVGANVPKDVAIRISQLSTIFSALDIAEIADEDGRDVELIASLYFKLGVRLELHWFLDQITRQPVANHWQALASASFREELDWQQRSLTAVVLRCDCDAKTT